MKLAPIALFVYNRLEHTRMTVESLKKNELAEDSDLVIFSDAAKTLDASTAVSDVRAYIKTVSGFRSIIVVERDENYGLARSIIDGVTSLINEYGRIIVLEDDLVTSPYFLRYMNDALEIYQNEEKVMHISGYMFPIDVSNIPETFFLRTASCWGWGTWQRAWVRFDKNPQYLLSDYSNQKIACFNMDGAYDFWSQVVQNGKGLINTWAIFWYAAVFELGGLCLHPAYSMVNNIGHDNSGEHCVQGSIFYSHLAKNPIMYYEKDFVENSVVYMRTRKFLRSASPGLLKRVGAAIKRRLFI